MGAIILPAEKTVVFAVFVFVFASGFASLLYQILWAREFAVILGSTVHAISTVLAAFMAGLGIGGIVLGRLADRSRWHPLQLYAAIEAAIGLTAILVEVALQIVPQFYGAIYNLPVAPQLFYIVRFLFTFSVLCIPTLFMGGTIPVIAKLLIRDGRRGAPAGWLYGWNTLGAACGAFAAGFFLIERLGMQRTLATAVGINLCIAFASLLLFPSFRRSVGRAIKKDDQKAPFRGAAHPSEATGGGDLEVPNSILGIVVYALSGFVSLGLEVAWSRTLVFSIGSTTYAFSAVLVLVLAGLAIGSILSTQILKRSENPLRWIATGQAALALLSILSLWLFTSFSAPLREWLSFSEQLSWPRQLLIQFVQAAALLLPSAIIFGALFPLAADLYLSTAQVGSRLGRLLGANTFAAIAGSLLTGFLFIPQLGIQRTYAVLGTVSFLGLLYVLRPRWMQLGGISAAWVVFFIMLPAQKTLEPVLPTEQLLFYKEGANGTVSVVEDYSGNRNLLIDHIAVAGTDPVFMTDQKSLAHLPMMLHPNPKKVLTVGFGSGGASYSFTRYPQLEAIRAVEIDPLVLEAAPYFQSKNGNPFADTRFSVIRDDARSYLLYGKDSYDIITTDCTDLRYKSNAMLYTQEFFEAAKQKLRPDGMVVAWVPLGGLSANDLKLTIRTFAMTFPNSSAWYMYNYPTHYLLLVGTTSELQFDLKRVHERMDVPTVRQDLAEIGLNDPFKLLACYFKNQAQLVAFAEGSPINSDDRPHLEFSVPKSPHAFSLSTNLERFVRETADVTQLLSSPVNMGAILRARSLMVEGHVVYNQGDNRYGPAIEFYKRAQALNPPDRSLNVLIQSVQRTATEKKQEYEKLAALNPSDYKPLNELGLLREDAGDLDGALDVLQKAARLAPGVASLHMNVGRIFDLKNQFEESAAAYRSALRLDPNYADAWNNLGIVYLEQQNYREAISAFEKSVALNPQSHTAWFNVGLASFRAGQSKRAREAYDRALGIKPNYAEAYLNRGILRLSMDDVNGAHSDLTLALHHRPGYAEAYYNLGIVEEKRKDFAGAAVQYQNAIRLDPKYVLAYNNLGILYSDAGQPRLAIDIYSKAISIDPNNPQLRNNLAMEYARTGNLADAITQYQKAIELQPRMFEPYANLGLIYRRRNQMAEAEKYLAEARKLNPNLKAP